MVLHFLGVGENLSICENLGGGRSLGERQKS